MASIKTKNNIGIEVWISLLTFNTHDETLQKALGRLLKTHFISEQSAKTSLAAGSAYAHRGASKTSISEICNVSAFIPSSLCQSEEVSDLLPAFLPVSAALLHFSLARHDWNKIKDKRTSFTRLTNTLHFILYDTSIFWKCQEQTLVLRYFVTAVTPSSTRSTAVTKNSVDDPECIIAFSESRHLSETDFSPHVSHVQLVLDVWDVISSHNFWFRGAF